MKKTTILLPVVAALLGLQTVQADVRDTVALNFGWQFHRGDVASPSALDGTAMETVDLPHDFQISQPWVAPAKDEKADNSDAGANVKSRLSPRGFKEMGVAWYRYELMPRDEWKNQRVLVDFEGIMMMGDAYLNGERIGGTDYGYLGFEADISKKLKYGQKNILTVRANTGGPMNSRWYTGGGLYRGVRLIVTPRDTYFGRHPLYIRTKDNRDVLISADIYNKVKTDSLNVGVRIIAADGKVVAESRQNVRFNGKWRQREYSLKPVSIDNARLWSCESPYLYTAEVTVYDKQGNTVDRVTDQFGVRTVEFSPKFGLKLNGKKVLLKGWAGHHTMGAVGAAAYPRAEEKMIRTMKEFGYNHIRTSHNPYSENLMRLCDKHGILVVDELYDKWNDEKTGGRADFLSLYQRDIPEFVTRDRNHPSVVMWSLGNELQQYSDMPFNDWGVTLYKLQRELLHRYDSTRLVTVAMHPRYRDIETDSIPAPLALNTDVASYNYRYMYFPGDSRRYPWMMFYQSEASTSAMGPNFFEMNLNKVIGLAYWGAIDYLGESQGWPAKGWANGVLDMSLEPKPTAYFVKSMFSDEPTVHIAVIERGGKENMWNGINVGTGRQSESWNRTEGDKVSLYTYTNADEVELFVNGKSQGVKKNPADPKDRDRIRWDNIAYASGNVYAVARNAGKTVATDRIETTGEAVKLQVVPDNQTWKADGTDLIYVRVNAVDKKNRKVLTAKGDLQFNVTGDARVVGVDNGDINSNESFTEPKRSLFQGSALVILRAGKKPSKVTLTVSSPGFKTVKQVLKTSL